MSFNFCEIACPTNVQSLHQLLHPSACSVGPHRICNPISCQTGSYAFKYFIDHHTSAFMCLVFSGWLWNVFFSFEMALLWRFHLPEQMIYLTLSRHRVINTVLGSSVIWTESKSDPDVRCYKWNCT